MNAEEHIDRYWDDDHHPATTCEICHTYYTLRRLRAQNPRSLKVSTIHPNP